MGKNKKLENWRLCLTHGDVIDYALAHNCQSLRTNGSHTMFRGPNGRTFPIQSNHRNWRMVPGMKAKIKREMLEAGVQITEE